MDSRHFLSAMFHSVVKCKLGNAIRVGTSDNLQRLHDTRNALTLKHQPSSAYDDNTANVSMGQRCMSQAGPGLEINAAKWVGPG